MGGDGNWSTGGNWSGTGKPVDADDVMIPKALGSDVTMSADEGDVDLDLLHVHKFYPGRVGTSGAPIKIAADLIEVFGSSGFYFECDDQGAPNHTTDEVRIATPTPDTPVELGNATGSTLGDFDRVGINRGNLTCKASIKWTAAAHLEVGFLNNLDSDAHVTLAATGPTLANLRMNGGRVESNVVITRADVCGGILVQDIAAITTVYVYRGGVLHLNGQGTVATTVVVYDGGTLDLLQTADDKILTDLTLWPGSIIKWSPNDVGADPGLHTITNGVKIMEGND